MEVNNLDKLVKAVTNNILNTIDISSISDKSCLILFQNSVFGFNEYINQIKEEYEGYELYLSTNDCLNDYDLNGIKTIGFDINSSSFRNVLESVENIIIIGLKISQMKSITETDDSEDINYIVLSSLMANKKVKLMINSNKKMYNLLLKQLNSIKQMDISITNIQDVKEVKDSELSVELITEDYVKKLKNSGASKIVLSNKQLITPLAKDKLRELNIDIVRKEERK